MLFNEIIFGRKKNPKSILLFPFSSFLNFCLKRKIPKSGKARSRAEAQLLLFSSPPSLSPGAAHLRPSPSGLFPFSFFYAPLARVRLQRHRLPSPLPSPSPPQLPPAFSPYKASTRAPPTNSNPSHLPFPLRRHLLLSSLFFFPSHTKASRRRSTPWSSRRSRGARRRRLHAGAGAEAVRLHQGLLPLRPLPPLRRLRPASTSPSSSSVARDRSPPLLCLRRISGSHRPWATLSFPPPALDDAIVRSVTAMAEATVVHLHGHEFVLDHGLLCPRPPHARSPAPTRPPHPPHHLLHLLARAHARRAPPVPGRRRSVAGADL